MTKVCQKCNQEKNISSFYADKRNGYILKSCKQCMKLYAIDWRKNNKDKYNKLCIDSYHKRKLENPDKYKDYWREYKRKYRAEKSKSANQHIITLAH